MNEKQYVFTYQPEFDFDNLDPALFEHVGAQKEDSERLSGKPYSYWKTVGKILFTNKAFIASLLFLLLMILLAIIVPIGHEARPLNASLPIAGPSAYHVFGIGINHEDYWTSIWMGTRTTIVFSLLVAAIEIFLGVALGAIWGYYKRLDIFFLEFTRFLTVIPTLVLWLIVIFVFSILDHKPNIWIILFAISITSWIGIAAIVRVQIILVRNTEYNVASQALGTPGRKIIVRNIFPRILPIIIQTVAFAIPDAIAIDSTLSYFNFGFVNIADRSSTSLGYILNQVFASSDWQQYPHLLAIPILIIIILSALFFLVGKIFADSLDPKTHR